MILATLFLAGCVVKPFVPQPSPSYSVEGRYAIVHSDSLAIIARPQAYWGRAGSIGSDFFPIFIKVRNISSKQLTLSRQSFSLIAGGRQYDHVPLRFVLGTIRLDVWDSQFRSEDIFDPTFPPQQDEYQAEAREQYLDLVNNYFSFGTILPGGEKQGYLFYDERAGRHKNLELDVLGTKVSFSRE